MNFQQIKQQFDWSDYLTQHHEVRQTGTSEARICCIACDDHEHKLYVNTSSGMFICFKCGFSTKEHDFIDFVAKTEGITRGQAMLVLKRRFIPTVPLSIDANSLFHVEAVSPHAGIQTIGSLPKEAVRLTERNDESADFYDYLIARGLTPNEITITQTHYVPNTVCPLYKDGKYKGDIGRRVMWPVYGGDGDLISWLARTIDPNYPGPTKYLNCPGSDLAKTFWPYIPPHGKRAILVEGLLDALSVRRMGSSASPYATFGKKIGEDQIRLLQSWGVTEVVLAWDAKDSKPEMLRAVQSLSSRFSHVFVIRYDDWPANTDAGDLLKAHNGVDVLQKALGTDQVLSYTSLDFLKWKMQCF